MLAAYAVSRLIAAIVIQGAAQLVQNPAGVGDLHPDYWDLVVIWDGDWYRQIAQRGYPDGLPLNEFGRVDYNSWAFFPLFPLLLRVVMTTGLPFSVAATVLNLAAGAGAAVVLWHLFAARSAAATASGAGTRRLSVLAVAIWCLLPPAAVLQAAYGEAVAALLLAAVLLLLVRRQYLWAVPVVLLLGVTRALGAPLLVVVLWHAASRWREARLGRAELSPADRRGLIALCGATASSALLWPAYVALATGVPNGFFLSQAVWGQDPAGGPFVPWFRWAWQGLGVLGVLLLLGGAAGLVGVAWSRHAAWLVPELRVWAVVYPLYLLAVVRPITSVWRFLLLDLPLAAVLASVAARAFGRASPARRRRLVAAGVVAVLVGMSWWVGELLTRTPWNDSPP